MLLCEAHYPKMSRKSMILGILGLTAGLCGVAGIATAQVSGFTWSLSSEVKAPIFDRVDIDVGSVGEGAGFRIVYGGSTVPKVAVMKRLQGGSWDALSAQADGVRDASFTRPNGDDVYWTAGMWRNTDGSYYAIQHIEYKYGTGSFARQRRIGVARSTNQGANWNYVGDIIAPSLSKSNPDPTNYSDFGTGDMKLMVDSAGGYFYIYYFGAFYDKRTGNLVDSTRYVGVARSPISSLMAPGSWTKWHNGGWTTPGIGGLDTPVNNFPGFNSRFAVHYNTYLGKYVAIGGDPTSGWLTTASNLSNQNWQPANRTFPNRVGFYNWTIDPANGFRYSLGRTIRLYSASNATGSGKYSTVTFTR
jgi:hypothetical protein